MTIIKEKTEVLPLVLLSSIYAIFFMVGANASK